MGNDFVIGYFSLLFLSNRGLISASQRVLDVIRGLGTRRGDFPEPKAVLRVALVARDDSILTPVLAEMTCRPGRLSLARSVSITLIAVNVSSGRARPRIRRGAPRAVCLHFGG